MSAFLSSDAGSWPSAGYVADADAAGHVVFPARQHVRPADGVEDVLRDGVELARVGAVLDQHDELVAAQPRHGVALAQVVCAGAARRPAAARSPASWPRLSLMFLKRSRSMKNSANCLPRRCASAERALQRVHEHRAVRQPGQLVEVREPADALLGAPRLRHVARDAAIAREHAVAVEDRLAGEADEAPLAVGVAHVCVQVAERLARRGQRVVAREIRLAEPCSSWSNPRPRPRNSRDAEPIALRVHAGRLR